MALTMDPQLATALAAVLAQQPAGPPPAVGDVASRRAAVQDAFPVLFAGPPQSQNVTRTDHTLTTTDGAELLLRWYAPAGEPTGAAVLYLHGGGMILGSVELMDAGFATFAELSGVPVLAVDYRLAPEHPHPVPVEDCYAALLWLANVDYDDNRTGWGALLGPSAGGPDGSPYAAPARATDLRGLPPAYLEIGDVNIFLDENLAYAAALAAAQVPVELHVHPGAVHGFELYAPNSDLAVRARADRVRALRSI